MATHLQTEEAEMKPDTEQIVESLRAAAWENEKIMDLAADRLEELQKECDNARAGVETFLLTLGKWPTTDNESLTVQPITEKSSAVQSTSSSGSGGASTFGGKGLGIAGAIWPPETLVTVNGKTFRLADIDKEMTE
jgi:hypothetical protein